MADFHGRKAVISGATKGIGKAIARAFLKEGATVIGIYSSDRQAADTFMQEWEADATFRENSLFLSPCDVSDESSVFKFFTEIEQKFDTIDILVNNAGIRRDAVLAMMKSDDWQRVLDVNLTGTFYMS
ncbi:MAG: SDR family NAD(P)-dependent oxidoreductase, partial [Deltaproteobacteria bacterium]|nr:SDR family NAD(P)-dependent oxidoreductase [Deltaproteobacteria bacterium]